MAEPTLKKGSRDPAVRELQQALQPLVSSPSGTVDGVFGDDTENDVLSFQSDQGLDADGVVGPATWRAIDLADLSEPLLLEADGVVGPATWEQINSFGD